MTGGPMSPMGKATWREPIAPGILPRPAALETVNLAPPDGALNGEVEPVEGWGRGRRGGSKVVGPRGTEVVLNGSTRDDGADVD